MMVDHYQRLLKGEGARRHWPKPYNPPPLLLSRFRPIRSRIFETDGRYEIRHYQNVGSHGTTCGNRLTGDGAGVAENNR